mmetsp:Transcript_20591/g.29863  ORF Transcript_20591/g.29863 Transcript_20591/m.29863 type:complete len:317 (+) Transcript_20591:16-966(+)|eukprot:11912512-Ditylum_brightwellii.AAC.1
MDYSSNIPPTREITMNYINDDESITMSSLISQEQEIRLSPINRGGVPLTVMTGQRRSPHKRLSNETSTTYSSCSSYRSEVSMESQPAHIPQSFTSNPSENEIITHLMEELAKSKAESEESLRRASVLAEKLMNENIQLRREANESKAKIDRLEEDVKRLSLQAPFAGVKLGRRMQTAKQEIRRSLRIEQLSKELPEEELPEEDTLKELPMENFGMVRQSSMMSRSVSIEVPTEEDDNDRGFFSFLLDKREKSSSIKVTPDALLWESSAFFNVDLAGLETVTEMNDTDNVALKTKGRRSASVGRGSLSSYQRINAVI